MRQFLITIAALATLYAPQAFAAAIAVDATSSVSGATATISLDYALNTGDTLQTACYEATRSGGTRPANKITDNGIPMIYMFGTPTSTATTANANDAIYCFYDVNPASGNHHISSTVAAVQTSGNLSVAAFSGTGTSNVLDAPVGDPTNQLGNTTGTSNLALATNTLDFSGDLIIDALAHSSGVVTPGSNQAFVTSTATTEMGYILTTSTVGSATTSEGLASSQTWAYGMAAFGPANTNQVNIMAQAATTTPNTTSTLLPMFLRSDANSYLTCGVFFSYTSSTITAPTWQGTAMTPIGNVSGTTTEISLYGLVNPATGSGNVSSTETNPGSMALGCSAWSNADQTTGFDKVASSSATNTGPATASVHYSNTENIWDMIAGTLLAASAPNTAGQKEISVDLSTLVKSIGTTYYDVATTTTPISTGWQGLSNANWLFINESVKMFTSSPPATIAQFFYGRVLSFDW